MSKKIKTYEIGEPYHQILWYKIRAHSKKEAIELLKNRVDLDGNQISEDCSTGCYANAKTVIKEIKES